MNEEFDIEKLADEYFNACDYPYDMRIHSIFKAGFELHQKLTKDKIYTIEQMKSCFFNGGDMKNEEDWIYFIESL